MRLTSTAAALSVLPPTIFETLPRAWSHPPRQQATAALSHQLLSSPSSLYPPPNLPKNIRSLQTGRTMSAGTPSSSSSAGASLTARANLTPSDSSNNSSNSNSNTAAALAAYGISSAPIPLAPGVTLSPAQTLVTRSVLDLFAGLPSLKKLSLWRDDATFADPLTIATGRAQVAAQWYGLPAVFARIERLEDHDGGCRVTSASPDVIELDMRVRYTLKGVHVAQTVASKVRIFTEAEESAEEGPGLRISRVEDRWGDKLPQGAFVDAMRNLNSVVVPMLVSVPKSEDEEVAVAAQKAQTK